MIERHEADVIVLWKWSRLSRDDYDWAVARKIARTAGGRIESATEPNDEETPEGRLMLNQMIAFAVYESDRIGSVWKETHARRRRLGLPHSGVDRFGYTKTSDGRYEVDPSSGPVLAEAYERYVRGEGFTRICRWLNEAGHRTLAGNLWGRVSLAYMLDSGFGAAKLIKNARKGHKSARNSEYTEASHAPVITPELWAAYLARRVQAPPAPRVIEPSYMLSGLIRCADCGSPMHASLTGGVSAYRCSRAREYRDVRSVTIRRALVEQAVTDWVLAFADDADSLAKAKARASETKVRAVNDADALRGAIAKIDQRLAQLTVRWMDGQLPESAFNATVAELDRKRASLMLREAASRTESSRAEVDVRTVAISLAAQWDRYTTLERRNALGSIIDSVMIHPASRAGTGVWRERIRVIPAFQKEK